MKPPEKMTVSQWADKNRLLDEKSSNEPGLWRTKRTPYLRAIMDAITDPAVEEIVFVKPTQVGGTECLLNAMGYIIDQDPSPTLVIYPSDTLAESISRDRIQPMVRKSPVLREKYKFRESKLLELQFPGMALVLTGANSPSQLASRPIRFLLLDEVDKYPPRAGKEGDTISLARERTKTFAYNRKIMITSTPTYTSGAVWQEFQSCETQYHFYIPCPKCGEYQRLRFRQVKYDNTLPTKSKQAASAYYACEQCGAHLSDADKAGMLQAGEWRADKPGSRKKIGFHLNAIYSPWVRFQDVVLEHLRSLNDLDIRMNFTNSWLGEPWEQVGMTADSDKILACRSRYTQGVVPDGALLLTGGVDKQKNCLYYTVRAWGHNRVSYNIDHGRVETLEELTQRFDSPFYDERGGAHYVQLALLDSGNDTSEVYDFCVLSRGLFAPVKGASTAINGRWRPTLIDKSGSIANGTRLILCDGDAYKSMIFSLIDRQDDGWYVFDGCDEEYARQMTAEHMVMMTINGRQYWKWRPKMSGIDNHYLDCEVYCTCAVDVLGGFDLLCTAEESQAEPEEPLENDWLGGDGNWI